MDIIVDSLLEGARRAEGTVVIIDVYRAFTTAAVAFSRGAKGIIFVSGIEDALKLRDEGAGELCVGEVNGIKPDGFDFGNSPYELSVAEVDGKMLIQSTKAGTVGVTSVRSADRIYVASFAIAEYVAKAILRDDPALVTIVAMGWEGKERTDEDEVCAWYIKNLLEGRRTPHEAIRSMVMAGEHSQKFDDIDQPQYHAEDRDFCLDVDSIKLAIQVSDRDGLMVASAQYA